MFEGEEDRPALPLGFGPQKFGRGFFGPVWESMGNEVWLPLAQQPGLSEETFSDLLRDAATCLLTEVDPGALADAISEPQRSLSLIVTLSANNFRGESGILRFLSKASESISEANGEIVAAEYFRLVGAFVWAHGLRYRIESPFEFSISASGMMTGLTEELQRLARTDSHRADMFRDLESALHDVRLGASPARVKKCVHAHFNFLESLASGHDSVRASTLSAQVKEITSWPHAAIAASLTNLYGFASDYPGIRHGGTASGALRDLRLLDLAALTSALVGFTPFLSDSFDSQVFELSN